MKNKHHRWRLHNYFVSRWNLDHIFYVKVKRHKRRLSAKYSLEEAIDLDIQYHPDIFKDILQLIVEKNS